MDLAFTEVQEELRKVLREFMRRNYPPAKVRELEDSATGFDAALWKQAAQMGWPGWIIPQEYGGLGGEFMDLVVLMEEMGRACFLSPFLSTALCAFPLIEGGSEEQKRKYLPAIASGDLILGLAWAEPGADYNVEGFTTRLVANKKGFSLTGLKFFVSHAQAASHFLVIARLEDSHRQDSIKDGLAFLIVDSTSAGIEITPLQTISQEKQNEVAFKETQIKGDEVLGDLRKGSSLLQILQERAMVLKCAEMLGGADWVMENCASYARERAQYGRPIGSYGIIQHYLAEMWVEIGIARRFLYYTADKLGKGMPCSREACMVKALFSEGYRRWTRMGVQVFGAIGTSREHDMGLYYRRAREAALLYGSPDWCREQVAREIGLG